MPADMQLFDMLFRHQVYLEGVKQYLSDDFKKQLRRLYLILQSALFTTGKESLDQLTQVQLNRLLSYLRKQQQTFYSDYNDELEIQLKDLIAADIDVTQQILSRAAGKKVESEDNKARLWALATMEPIPANGLLMLDWLSAFGIYATNQVIALVRQGYVNNWTITEALNKIVGSVDAKFRDGFFARLAGQQTTLINTVEQHLSSLVQNAVASTEYEHYQWVAVLDNKTTEICRSRNGNVYIYGKGPLPPAHYNCRSKAVPIDGETEVHNIPESYYDWLVKQPIEFQNDALGIATAQKLRSGELTAKSFTDIGTVKPISIDEFRSKVKFMLAS